MNDWWIRQKITEEGLKGIEAIKMFIAIKIALKKEKEQEE